MGKRITPNNEKEVRVQVSANVGQKAYKIAKKNGIGWTEALEVGIKILAKRKKK